MRLTGGFPHPSFKPSPRNGVLILRRVGSGGAYSVTGRMQRYRGGAIRIVMTTIEFHLSPAEVQYSIANRVTNRDPLTIHRIGSFSMPSSFFCSCLGFLKSMFTAPDACGRSGTPRAVHQPVPMVPKFSGRCPEPNRETTYDSIVPSRLLPLDWDKIPVIPSNSILP